MSTHTAYFDDVSNRDFCAQKIRKARRERKARLKAEAAKKTK